VVYRRIMPYIDPSASDECACVSVFVYLLRRDGVWPPAADLLHATYIYGRLSVTLYVHNIIAI